MFQLILKIPFRDEMVSLLHLRKLTRIKVGINWYILCKILCLRGGGGGGVVGKALVPAKKITFFAASFIHSRSNSLIFVREIQ